MRTRSLAGYGVCLAVGLAVAGCGTSDSNAPAVASSTDTTKGERVEFLSNLTEPGDAAALQSLMAVHKRRHPNDTLLNTTIPLAEFPAYVSQRITTGEPPGVFMTAASAATAYGPLQSLSEFLSRPAEADIVPNIYPEFMADVTVDGQIYQLPWAAPRTNTILYNKQVFAQHQLNPPTSIAEFRVVCQTLRAAGVTPVGVVYPTALIHDLLPGVLGVDAYYQYIRGGTPDEAALRSAIDLLAEVVDHYIDPRVLELPNFSENDEIEALMSGKTAMFFTGDWTSGNLKQLGWLSGIDYGIAQPPGSAGLFQYVLISLAVPASSRDLQGALNFLDTALSLEGQAAFDTTRNGVSARMDADMSKFDPEWRASIDEMRRAKYRYPITNADLFTPFNAFVQSQPHDKEALLKALLTTR